MTDAGLDDVDVADIDTQVGVLWDRLALVKLEFCLSVPMSTYSFSQAICLSVHLSSVWVLCCRFS